MGVAGAILARRMGLPRPAPTGLRPVDVEVLHDAGHPSVLVLPAAAD